MTLIERSTARLRELPPGIRTAAKCTIVFLLVLGLSYWLVLADQVDELDANEMKELVLKQTFLDKKKQAVNLPAYLDHAREIDRAFGAVVSSLPPTNRGYHERALRAATVHGLRIDHMNFPDGEKQRELYAQLTASLKVSGSFYDVGAFLNDLGELGSLMTVDDFRIEATAAPAIVSMDATVSAFRYLDEEEMAVQRKKAAAARKGSKK